MGIFDFLFGKTIKIEDEFFGEMIFSEFKKIESNYEKTTSNIKPLIEDQFQNWKENFEIKDFKKEFKAVYLHLSRCEKSPKIWEIAFESEHDLNHTFTLTMNDLKATEILIDG